MSYNVPESARLETKFVISSIYKNDLLNWIRLNPAIFIVPYPDRWINNIYFETFEYDAFKQNIAGISSRNKVRYRWYGESESINAGVLEVKCKRNQFGWKLRYDVNEAPWVLDGNWRTIKKSILKQLPVDGKIWLEAYPIPIIKNCYYRKYFVTADGKIRITVDINQSVSVGQKYKSSVNINKSLNKFFDIMIIEVKFSRENRAKASEIIKKIPIRVSRYSKYITGLRSAQGIQKGKYKKVNGVI